MLLILNKGHMNPKQPLVDAVGQGRCRLTRQRKLVLEILDESLEHLDAETLYLRAKARDPNISLATVYRSLAWLKAAGLVEEHRLGEGHGHFETIQETPHYHFICLGCGRVVEFAAPQVMQAARKLGESQGLTITGVTLHLSGFCPGCQPEVSSP